MVVMAMGLVLRMWMQRAMVCTDGSGFGLFWTKGM
jgi:hypothetical protein